MTDETTALALRAELLGLSFNDEIGDDFRKFDALCCGGHAPAEYHPRGASVSEQRLAEVLDLLQRIEPWLAREGERAEDRFGRVVKSHYKEKGHGTDKAGLNAWMVSVAAEVGEMLKAEGREPFDQNWEPEGEPIQ